MAANRPPDDKPVGRERDKSTGPGRPPFKHPNKMDVSANGNRASGAAKSKGDLPGRPFRTPNKTGTHAAPEVATDGLGPWPEQDSDRNQDRNRDKDRDKDGDPRQRR